MNRSGAIVLLCGALAGCAGGGAPPERAVPARTVDAPGPIVVERAAEELPDSSQESGITESASPDDWKPVRVFHEGDDVPRRPDGRPSWWLDSNVRTDGRTRFCAEAIAGSILEARRAAVRRAEVTSARLGGAEDVEYLRTWVWPIRATGDIRENYAAFVMAEVATPE